MAPADRRNGNHGQRNPGRESMAEENTETDESFLRRSRRAELRATGSRRHRTHSSAPGESRDSSQHHRRTRDSGASNGHSTDTETDSFLRRSRRGERHHNHSSTPGDSRDSRRHHQHRRKHGQRGHAGDHRHHKSHRSDGAHHRHKGRERRAHETSAAPAPALAPEPAPEPVPTSAPNAPPTQATPGQEDKKGGIKGWAILKAKSTASAFKPPTSGGMLDGPFQQRSSSLVGVLSTFARLPGFTGGRSQSVSFELPQPFGDTDADGSDNINSRGTATPPVDYDPDDTPMPKLHAGNGSQKGRDPWADDDVRPASIERSINAVEDLSSSKRSGGRGSRSCHGSHSHGEREQKGEGRCSPRMHRTSSLCA